MRNRHRTIEALQRLAERPGTEAEGIAARKALERLGSRLPVVRPFNLAEFPRFTRIYYAYWCYWNKPGEIVGKQPKVIRGQTWLRVKFDDLKTPRYVPVTSAKGSHISKTPFSEEDTEYLHNSWM